MPSRSTKPKTTASAVKIPIVPVRDNVHFPTLVSTLLVGRELSLKALQAAVSGSRLVLVVGQRDLAVDEPRGADLYQVGTLSEVVQVMPMPDGTMRVVLRGNARARLKSVQFRAGHLKADYEVLVETGLEGSAGEALRREAIEAFHQVAALGKQVPIEVLEILPSIHDAGHLSDLLTDHLSLAPEIKQELLEELNCSKRLEMLIHRLTSERQVLELQNEVRMRVEQELGNTQREYFLREQLKVIQSELTGGDVPFSPENEALAAKICSVGMPEDTQAKCLSELRRLERAPSSSPEGMVIRTWLEWLTALPWQVTSEDRLDVTLAAEMLDRNHFGLGKVKDRILDYLAVRQLSGSLRGPILCFAGPPGVGKTSIGRNIAEAMGRKFVRISLGGIRDEAEIRGHRRTYIGSLPGRIIQGIRQCGTRNPVFILDEIDKMTADLRGDPTSALLEALDPEQNAGFSDHYVEAPFDLSAVMFIMTANVVEAIPGPLRDRMEIIHFSSYTEIEKHYIASNFLLPKQREEHGLAAEQVQLSSGAVETIIRRYTRESGVRSLSREIGTVCRKVARKIAEGTKNVGEIGESALTNYLGHPRYRYGIRGEADEIGAVTGLVYTEVGGDIVTIEASLMPRAAEKPDLILTGCLGNVMVESAKAALSVLRAQAERLKPGSALDADVHIHVPDAAVPKDGPSAGVTIFTALASAFLRQTVRKDVAMTGEITLRGNVLPVGGIREKVLAAHRAGIVNLILPFDNERDLDDVPAVVRDEISFHFVKNVDEVLKLALLPADKR